MPTLLISLGTSPAIVPEAFLMPGVTFDAVHVLTTEKTSVEFVIDWFATHAPNVRLTITRVSGFADFQSEEDHFHFEEVLYRWWLEHAAGDLPYACLSGGFKTMSAAVQKAAAVFGAKEVFHVLCNLPGPQQPKNAAEIQAADDSDLLQWIRLGAESGWPQFRAAHTEDYPLIEEQSEGVVKWVRAPDDRFRKALREVIERSHNIAGAWSVLSELPFPVLATWAAADLDWLRQPVDLESDRLWITRLPKVELHCHLGGFATHGKSLYEVRGAAENVTLLPTLTEPPPPAGWPLPAEQLPLADYMKLGDANGSTLLKDPGCLHRQCELLHAHLLEQNIVYAEIRCSPGNYTTPERSPWTVLEQIKTSFDRCMAENPGCHVNLIIIATRRETGDYRAAISRHLALAVSAAEHWTGENECRVVGVDLAGYEDVTTRAHYFREEFTAIHRCGLALTVHAGENDDAEGIWRAVFDLNARRLGHALHLIDSPELMRSVADRGVCIEMCPYANYQIKGFLPMEGRPVYPLKHYLDSGLRVTINTDNIGISAASLTDNLCFASTLCPDLTRLDLLRMLAHAIDSSFLSAAHRCQLRLKVSAGLRQSSSISRSHAH